MSDILAPASARTSSRAGIAGVGAYAACYAAALLALSTQTGFTLS